MRRDDFEKEVTRLPFAVLICSSILVFATSCGNQSALALPGESESPAVAYRLPIVPVPDNTNEIEFYKERIERDPSGGLDLAALAGAYLTRAKRSRDHHWLDEAGSAAERSFKNLPVNNRGARVVLAAVAQEQHDFTRALAITSDLLAASPGHVSALSIAATSHFAMGNLDEALAFANAWVKREAMQPALSHRAVILAARGRDAEAMRDFRAALDAEQVGEIEASVWTRSMLGRFHMKRGRIADARAAFTEALRIAPKSVVATAALAELEARFGDVKVAKRLYLQLNYQTTEASWLAKAASVMAATGDRSAALPLWQLAIDELRAGLEHGHNDHRRDLANILLARGRAADIVEARVLANRDASARRDLETVLCYSWALIRAGDIALARPVVHEAIAAGHLDARLFERAAEIEMLTGRARSADPFREKAHSVNPKRDQLSVRAASALGRSGP